VQINVSARHGTLSGPDSDIVREKAGKLQRFHDRINAISVTVDFQHQESPWLEINVTAEHAPEFVASANAPTVIAAMDSAMSKVEQQLRKHKEKLTGHKASSVKHIPAKDETGEE
jgi:putative sigma-54 modulation protein